MPTSVFHCGVPLPKKPLPAEASAPVDRRPYRWIVFSVAFAVFMVRLDSYIVNISLPSITRYFHIGTGEASWIVLSYMLVMTGSMLIFGKLGDRIGLKKIFMIGYAVFTVGSLFCGISNSIYVLDLARGVQGIGGAMMVTGAFAIISHYLPEAITGWAFGLCSLANSLGIMVGAPLGGIISGLFSWQWIFLINIPMGIAAVAIAGKALPDEKPNPVYRNGEKMPFDVAGSMLSFIGFSALVYGLSMGHEAGWTSIYIIAALVIAVVALGAFVYREMRHCDPILNLKLFRNSDFAFANLTTLTALMLLAGGNFLLPFYLEFVKGLNTEMVGLVVLIYSIVYLPIAPFAGELSDRINPRLICSAAMLIGLIACAAFAFCLPLAGLIPVVVFLILLAMTYSLFFPSNNHLVMSLAPPDSLGSASGIYTTAMNVSMVMGICLFQGVFAYALPDGVSLKNLSPALAVPLRGVLTDAFQVAFAAGSLFCLLAFVFSLLTGRRAKREG